MTSERLRERILENVRLAAGCGASSSSLLTVALATSSASTVSDAIDELQELREALSRVESETPRPHASLAVLEPELVRERDVGRMRLDIGDHELRGRLLYADLLGKKSFMQVAALSIAGIDLSASDAELVENIGVLTQLVDPRIWPLAVARRIAANGGGLASALVAGLATLCTPQMTGQPVAGFIQFLDRVEPLARRARIAEVLRHLLGRGEHIAGVGRPVLRSDERVPQILDLARRHGRYDGKSLQLALELDAELHRQKGLRVNSAGFCGAILRDIGFAPDAGAALCMLYFVVPVLTHAIYRGPGLERAVGDSTPKMHHHHEHVTGNLRSARGLQLRR
jgi:hypothetical protein